MKPIKIACVGAGYFARFHVEAWQRIPEVELLAICDRDRSKALVMAEACGIRRVYADLAELFAREQIDLLDIITPPETHDEICRQASSRGIPMICQKPLAPSLRQAREMVALAEDRGLFFAVHENWRFQPWYRKIRELLDQNSIGDRLHSIRFQMRTGDGWPADAYLNRQPYFRSMPRLLIYETGIHFIDTFRFLAGEIDSVYADLRKLNPDIAGEDCGLVLFTFANGARGIFDANRFNEPNTSNPRYTFGEMLLEGNGGGIRLYTDGRITLQRLGQAEEEVDYQHEDKNFAGDCVYFLQRHIVEALLHKAPLENSGAAYIRNLEVQEAIYRSAAEQRRVGL